MRNRGSYHPFSCSIVRVFHSPTHPTGLFSLRKIVHRYHAGMPGADPTGLLSYSWKHHVVPQAYSPLGNYATHSLLKANITAEIGAAHSKSAAQVGLRWVIQNNASLCVAADKGSYLAEDIDIFSWSLSDAEMTRLDEWAGAREDPTRGSCV